MLTRRRMAGGGRLQCNNVKGLLPKNGRRPLTLLVCGLPFETWRQAFGYLCGGLADAHARLDHVDYEIAQSFTLLYDIHVHRAYGV